MKNTPFDTIGAEKKSGCLYIVSTPIGNLGDITYRAVETLRSVRLIAAEDTRRASILTRRYTIKTPLISFYEQNARRRLPELLKHLHNNEDIALISDAGTPGISDPGYLLIRQCIDESVPVVAIPGSTAFVAALSVSGLPTDRFIFEGFLPVKKGRTKRLEELAQEERTIILYESPHRIGRTLSDLQLQCGDREIVIVRELTKLYEEVIRTTLSRAIQRFKESKPRGEYVLVIHGADKE
jgi:16S rRNA (cytidine1402-2'-O)-methyltransferase